MGFCGLLVQFRVQGLIQVWGFCLITSEPVIPRANPSLFGVYALFYKSGMDYQRGSLTVVPTPEMRCADGSGASICFFLLGLLIKGLRSEGFAGQGVERLRLLVCQVLAGSGGLAIAFFGYTHWVYRFRYL